MGVDIVLVGCKGFEQLTAIASDLLPFRPSGLSSGEFINPPGILSRLSSAVAMYPEPRGPVTTRVHLPTTGRRTRHYRGLPPELTGGVDTREDMPPAVLALARTAGDGSWYLDRYAEEGSFAGNTWHETWADAIAQLEFEFEAPFAFDPVPEGAADSRAYAQKLARQG